MNKQVETRQADSAVDEVLKRNESKLFHVRIYEDTRILACHNYLKKHTIP